MLGKATVAMVFVLLVWGNMVAGLKAGLACPDWPLCHGKVVPPFRLDIYMEFGHRVIAAVTSLMLVALSYTRFRAYRGPARAVPVAVVMLLAAEIVVGGLVVVMELPVRLTTVHFMSGLIIFLLASYMANFDGAARRPVFPVGGVSVVVAGVAALVFTQAALGAYVRHAGAGLSCPDWPTCLGGWLPPVMDSGVLAHYSHRIAAYIIALTALALYAFSRLENRFAVSRGPAGAVLLLVLVQVAVGVAVVYTGLYFAATALHLAVALAILYVLGGMWASGAKQGEVTR